MAWGMTGACSIDPIAGDVAATPGTVIGIVRGFALIAGALPDLGDIDADNRPTPDLRAPSETKG